MLKTLRTSITLNSQLLTSRSSCLSLAHGSVGARAARSYATETALPSTSSANPVTLVGKGKKSQVPEGPLRPHLGVEVNPNHGLWAFFRKKVGKGGVQSYETIEAKNSAVDYSGTLLSMLSALHSCVELRLACLQAVHGAPLSFDERVSRTFTSSGTSS